MVDAAAEWRSSKLGSGVAVNVLRRDEQAGAITVLLRFDPGGTFPAGIRPEKQSLWLKARFVSGNNA